MDIFVPEVQNGDPFALAEQYLLNLQRLDPDLMERYLNRLKSFPSNSRFIPDLAIVDVLDSHHVGLLNHCRLEQLAVRHRPLTPFDKSFLISKDLWQQLSTSDQAGLILHEIIYEDFIQRGERNSLKARKFNALVSSGRIKELSLTDYHQLFSQWQFAYFTYKGLTLLTNSVVIENETITKAQLVLPQKIQYPSNLCEMQFGENNEILYEKWKGRVTFNSEGVLQSFFGSVKTCLVDDIPNQTAQIFSWITGNAGMIIENPILFHQDGRIKSGVISSGSSYKNRSNQINVVPALHDGYYSVINLDQNGLGSLDKSYIFWGI